MANIGRDDATNRRSKFPTRGKESISNPMRNLRENTTKITPRQTRFCFRITFNLFSLNMAEMITVEHGERSMKVGRPYKRHMLESGPQQATEMQLLPRYCLNMLEMRMVLNDTLTAILRMNITPIRLQKLRKTISKSTVKTFETFLTQLLENKGNERYVQEVGQQ